MKLIAVVFRFLATGVIFALAILTVLAVFILLHAHGYFPYGL